ncbi:YdcF family protein [Pontibacter qinzhouensis]|uniref:YdcF family protein n=1 Tax=Pontibacter qinzhouensis TaxID=2603253 RepID=A0A5C8KAX0_9BACT|nr:YdcF family protein [Pontibacter qinzhouensis]TXK50776.1 YdcF family protein [Pontibacter qinzhouensis]
MYYSKRFFILLLTAFAGLAAATDTLAQSQTIASGQAATSGNFPKKLLLHKTFNFLEVIDESAVVRKEVKQNAVLRSLAQQYAGRAERALSSCQDATCYASALKWSDQEIASVTKELNSLYIKNKRFKKAVTKALQAESYHLKYKGEIDSTTIRKAWEDTALGLNHILDVYVGGTGARYPAIDSISFNTTDPEFLALLQQELQQNIHAQEALFYKLPLQAALGALELNGRDEAARYEPLQDGYNRKPYEASKRTVWNKYAYSMILVLGHGPEDPATALDEGGAHYCEVAAKMYKEGVAPFIVVSGGNVHPYKTPFNEAEEMKKYLVTNLGVPDEAVFIEPHARHTTTNLRNISRMIYSFNMPDQKPVLTLTNSDHSQHTLTISDRCMRELGYLPFRDMKKISDETNAFFPVPEALRVNPYEPLDP